MLRHVLLVSLLEFAKAVVITCAEWEAMLQSESVFQKKRRESWTHVSPVLLLTSGLVLTLNKTLKPASTLSSLYPI
jgi:hypothetical protein